MKPEEMNDLCKQCFLEIVFDNSDYKDRTYCYFNPFRGKDLRYHITMVDKATGYGLTVPLDSKACIMLEKEDVKQVFSKVMEGLKIAVKKHSKHATPVDYKSYPIKANGKMSLLDKIERKNKTAVEIYSWSKILV